MYTLSSSSIMVLGLSSAQSQPEAVLGSSPHAIWTQSCSELLLKDSVVLRSCSLCSLARHVPLVLTSKGGCAEGHGLGLSLSWPGEEQRKGSGT